MRKGKALLKRSFRLLDDATAQLLCSTMFQLLPLVLRKDKEERLVNGFWPDLKRHLRRASFGLLSHYLRLLNAGAGVEKEEGKSSSKQTLSTFKAALCSGLGVSVIALAIKRVGSAYPDLCKEDKKVAEELAQDVLKAVGDCGDMTSPLEAIKLQEVKGFIPSERKKELAKLAEAVAAPSDGNS